MVAIGGMVETSGLFKTVHPSNLLVLWKKVRRAYILTRLLMSTMFLPSRGRVIFVVNSFKQYFGTECNKWVSLDFYPGSN